MSGININALNELLGELVTTVVDKTKPISGGEKRQEPMFQAESEEELAALKKTCGGSILAVAPEGAVRGHPREGPHAYRERRSHDDSRDGEERAAWPSDLPLMSFTSSTTTSRRASSRSRGRQASWRGVCSWATCRRSCTWTSRPTVCSLRK